MRASEAKSLAAYIIGRKVLRGLREQKYLERNLWYSVIEVHGKDFVF